MNHGLFMVPCLIRHCGAFALCIITWLLLPSSLSLTFTCITSFHSSLFLPSPCSFLLLSFDPCLHTNTCTGMDAHTHTHFSLLCRTLVLPVRNVGLSLVEQAATGPPSKWELVKDAAPVVWDKGKEVALKKLCAVFELSCSIRFTQTGLSQ